MMCFRELEFILSNQESTCQNKVVLNTWIKLKMESQVVLRASLQPPTGLWVTKQTVSDIQEMKGPWFQVRKLSKGKNSFIIVGP